METEMGRQNGRRIDVTEYTNNKQKHETVGC
jgi:hypothetical protein